MHCPPSDKNQERHESSNIFVYKMGFFKRVFIAMIISGIIGFAISYYYIPVEQFQSDLAYIQLPIFGEISRITLFLSGMFGVIGGGLMAVVISD